MHRIHPIIAIGCLCCISAVPAVHAADLEPKPSGPVLSMREFELKPGVKAEDFDAFVRKEMADDIAKDVAGMKMYVLKGDRGARRAPTFWSGNSTPWPRATIISQKKAAGRTRPFNRLRNR